MRAGWFVLCAIGCGGGSGDGGETGNCPGFATIVDGGFSRVGTTLTWTLEVEEIPAELTFDREGIPNFVLEYGWSIELDTNGDGTTDWQVAALHFKEDREPRATSDLLTIAQVDLWQVFGAGSTIAGSADATISGNTFTFTVEQDEDPDLVNVTERASYTTFHMTGPSIITDQCEDRLDK